MSDQFATVNGERAQSLSVTFPYQGTWSADVLMAQGIPVERAVTIKIGDMVLNGTAIRMASFAGSRGLRVVGGSGGWRKNLAAKGYGNITGVKLSSVINDAARESGEQLSTFTDRVLGTNWARENGPAERTLRFLAPGWWMSNDGKTHIEPRVQSAVSTQFTVNSWSGGKGKFEISTENISDWSPGKTFSAPTVPETQVVNSMTVEMTNDGKLRLGVLNGSSSNRMLDDVRHIVRDEISSLSYSGIWEYTLFAGTLTTCELQSTTSQMPDLGSVPYASGLMGEQVVPAPGSKCRVVFLNSDPSRPVVIGIDGSPSLIKIQNGIRPLAATGDVAGVFPIVGTAPFLV
jgi:hypothetical protein